jgi:hypothetical protein
MISYQELRTTPALAKAAAARNRPETNGDGIAGRYRSRIVNRLSRRGIHTRFSDLTRRSFPVIIADGLGNLRDCIGGIIE